MLITSAEHYGVVIDSSLDYKAYLDVLEKYHFNLTRVFVGTYFEGNYHDAGPKEQQVNKESNNTLAVPPDYLLVPWARSNIPGYASGGNKFDLDKWDNRYFVRLKEFCREASARGIVVEIVFFSANYKPAYWMNSPLNSHNNINHTEAVSYNEVYHAANKKLIRYQLAVVGKIVREVNEFDNVYFELCNEPYWLKGIPEVDTSIHGQEVTPEIYSWQHDIAVTIKKTERNLAKKHLIAQNFANTYLKITDPDPDVSVLNFHYAYPPRAVTDNYALNKPVAFDETSDGLDADGRRREAWAFMLAGGAVYNNLDWSFTTHDMTGHGLSKGGTYQSGKPVRNQLEILHHALASFDFIDARPLDSSYKIKGMAVYGLGINGKDYMMYLLKAKPATPPVWRIPLPTGRYRLKWIDPSNGKISENVIIQSYMNQADLKIPSFNQDQVLRIERLKEE